MDDQPLSQSKKKTYNILKKKPMSRKPRASNLLGVRGQAVKKKKLDSDMAASLDQFCEYTCIIEELKL